ncbi:MAG: BTAD domain-containing putative transcriptional regulator, partial [Caldimonas sp.]
MASDTVHLRLIGRPELFLADRPLRLPTRKTLALLAILALSTQRLDRASLAALLWADRDAAAARRNLRHELHRLRHAGLDGAIDDDGDTLSLGAVEVDVHVFRKACATGDAAVAAACGPGPLLDGFTIVDGTAFDEWVAGERSRHRDQWADAAERHASALRRAGHLREALVLLDALCGPNGVDPLRESAVREAMRCQAALGEVEAALRRHERH